MQVRFDRRTVLVFVALVAVCLSLADASAQRRRRRSRRVTNPVASRQTITATPTPVPDARIISTAEDSASNTENSNDASDQSTTTRATTTTTNRTRSTAVDSDQDMRRSVNKLSRDLSRITEKVDKMEEAQRTIVFMDLLSRAEQRAENLRAQLRDVEEKEANLQARALQLETDIKPDNIERAVALNGSTRPEDAREGRRRQLENERASLQSRLQQFTTSRARLEAAIATTDQEIERLRARIDAFVNPQNADPSTNANTSTNATDEGATATTNTSTTPTPVPSPSPPF